MGIDILNIQVNIVLKWMPNDFVDQVGPGYGLLPSGKKPLPEPVLTKFSPAIWSKICSTADGYLIIAYAFVMMKTISMRWSHG